jgi:hypothetical protein
MPYDGVAVFTLTRDDSFCTNNSYFVTAVVIPSTIGISGTSLHSTVASAGLTITGGVCILNRRCTEQLQKNYHTRLVAV